jgi:hypothetical protein
MRDLRLTAALAGLVAVYGLATAPAAFASTTLTMQGASCQLSIPTTDTGVRPKATGFRNESATTSNFVICTFVSPASGGNNSSFLTGFIDIASLDGVAKTVTCTAVVGSQALDPLKYSTKTIELPIHVAFNGAYWSSTDFGQSSGSSINGSTWFSITCLLPPQAGIAYLSGEY